MLVDFEAMEVQAFNPLDDLLSRRAQRARVISFGDDRPRGVLT